MIQIFLLLFGICFCPIHLQSLEYGLIAKYQGGPIQRFAILSERCSGSNFVEKLIQSNFENLKRDDSIHKHFPPRNWNERKTNDILFIVIFRNPYDWLRSFHRVPHHAAPHLYGIPFGQFIRSLWALNAEDPVIKKLGDPMVDRHPRTGLPFKNVMELRTEKIMTMLQIRKKVENIYYLNYETARDYPREVLQEIQERYSLKTASSYLPVLHYKAIPLENVYSPRKYDPISRRNLRHINSHLNKRLESKIGYRLIFDPENIP